MSDLSEHFIKPVCRKTLTQEIVDQLTELIMKRKWKPGDIIPSEKALASHFQVGRSTVREALQVLHAIGVLETTSRGRQIVEEPNSELLSGAFRWGLILGQNNLEDLTEVRLNTEVECTALAAIRRDDQHVEKLTFLYEKMIQSEHDEKSFIHYDNLFHRTIAEGSKNLIYVNLVSTIQSLVRLWYPASYTNPNTMKRTRGEHLLIIEAIKSKDEEKARDAMRDHVLSASKRLQKVLSEN